MKNLLVKDDPLGGYVFPVFLKPYSYGVYLSTLRVGFLSILFFRITQLLSMK